MSNYEAFISFAFSVCVAAAIVRDMRLTKRIEDLEERLNQTWRNHLERYHNG